MLILLEPHDIRVQSKEVEVGNEKLEVVPELCYLGDMLSAGGSCELAAITRCKCAWRKFRQLLPLLTNQTQYDINIGTKGWGMLNRRL